MTKEKKTCFVIMPFGKKETSEYSRNWKIYESMIKPIAEKFGYRTVRADELEYFGSITRDIIEYLHESDLVIADLSGRNANVYYELGVRHSLFKCGTIPIIHEGEQLPFDIADYRAVFYTIELDGPEKFRQELEKRIHAFEKIDKKRPDNPVHQILGDKLFDQNKIESLTRDLQSLRDEREPLLVELEKLKSERAEQKANTKRQTAEKQQTEKTIIQLNNKIKELEQQLAYKIQDNEPATKTSAIRYRSKALTMDEEAVTKMFKMFGFFDKNKNPKGKGAERHYSDKVINKNKVVIDDASGLMWQQGGSEVSMTKEKGDAWIKSLNAQGYAGFKDWRLPTLEEAMSLMEPKKHGDLYIDPLFDQTQQWIWTSDKVEGGPWAWVVFFLSGFCHASLLDSYGFYVRAVRIRQSSAE